MRVNLSKEEREELDSLKRDLFDPVKSFAAEVSNDTLGDAKRFYAAKANKAKQSAAIARDRAVRQAEALRHEQERMRRQRRVMAKRALIVLALLALFCIVVISAALSAHAEPVDQLPLREPCLNNSPEKRSEMDYSGILDRSGKSVTIGTENKTSS